MPVQDNSKEIEDGKHAKNGTGVEEQIGQHHTRTVLIPEEALVVEESRFEKPHFIIQTILTVIGLVSLGGFIWFSIVQHEDNVRALKSTTDALDLAKQNAASSDIISKQAIALADSSLQTTKKSARIYEYLTKSDLRAYVVLKEMTFQLRVGQKPRGEYQYINLGKTPARHVVVMHCLVVGDAGMVDRATNILKGAASRRDSIGYVIGSNISPTKDFVGDAVLTRGDSVAIANGTESVYLLGLIGYYDKFNERHLTWFCHTLYFDGSYGVYPKFNDAN